MQDVTGRSKELFHSFSSCVVGCLVGWLKFTSWGVYVSWNSERMRKAASSQLLFSEISSSCRSSVRRACHTIIKLSSCPQFKSIDNARDKPDLSDQKVNVMRMGRNLSYNITMAAILHSFRQKPKTRQLTSFRRGGALPGIDQSIGTRIARSYNTARSYLMMPGRALNIRTRRVFDTDVHVRLRVPFCS
jgi:hypothetical protein